MLICFTLSMPGRSSWDGRWSGDGELFALVRSIPNTSAGKERAISILANPSYGYNFGDGWRASVSVRQVNSQEAARVRKKKSRVLWV